MTSPVRGLRRAAPAICAALLAVSVSLGLSACGSGDATNGTTSPPAAQQPRQGQVGDTMTGASTNPSAAQQRPPAETDNAPPPPARKVAARPGCGELCQQAGIPQGTDDPGCPGWDSDNCAPCPKNGCAALLPHSARAHDGLFTVTLRCNVDHPCTGALQLYLSGTLAILARSDVSVRPQETKDVDIALTPLGRHVAAYKGDVRGYVAVFLEGTGMDELGGTKTSSDLRLQATRTRLTRCDPNISAAQSTSCPFAENVFVAYVDKGQSFTAKSPTTGRSYRMYCHSDLKTVYCTGGNDAFVTFPQRAAEVYK